MFNTLIDARNYVLEKEQDATENGYARVVSGIYLQTFKDIKERNTSDITSSFFFFDAKDEDLYIVNSLDCCTLVVPFNLDELSDELYELHNA